MTGFSEPFPQIFRGPLGLPPGALGALLKKFGAQTIVGHPTLETHRNIGSLIAKGIRGAVEHFPEQKVAFVIADGSFNENDADARTLEAAIEASRLALMDLNDTARRNVLVAVLPYGGYAGNTIQGKGSGLKMIFEEMGATEAKTLILLDGDLRNDVGDWLRVYRKTIDRHQRDFPDKNFFITARYARHFVDASITRFVVGPLTTLLGAYVPGGISGDIVLSSGAVALERKAKWNDSRYRYGVDISTTMDNIANETVIYEVYLGAKLHDVTDDAKLSVMPGEVIAAGLERILFYEKLDGRVTRLLQSDQPLRKVIALGPAETNISFINPGRTGVFNLRAKQRALAERFQEFEKSLGLVLNAASMDQLRRDHAALTESVKNNDLRPRFLKMTRPRYVNLMHQCVAYALKTGDIDHAKGALNYLYTAAFLEFCLEKLAALGHASVEAIESVQTKLGVEGPDAERFYVNEVDRVAEELALEFFKNRNVIQRILTD